MDKKKELEKTVEHQFDCFCKTVLRNYARDLYEEHQRRDKNTISLEVALPSELETLAIYDTYDLDTIYQNVHGQEVAIYDDVIAEAIDSLSERQKDIILLSYFVDMTNKEIAMILSVSESTVHYHKKKAIEKLKQFFKED